MGIFTRTQKVAPSQGDSLEAGRPRGGTRAWDFGPRGAGEAEIEPPGSGEFPAPRAELGRVVRQFGTPDSLSDSLLFLERARDVPTRGGGAACGGGCAARSSACRPSVRAWVEDAGGQQIGDMAEWGARPCNQAPSWCVARPLGISLRDPRAATLRIEVCDRGTFVGRLALAACELPFFEVITREVDVDPALSSAPGDPCTLTFQLLDASKLPPGRRVVYFIRHAESRWNQAQKRFNLFEMAKGKDHPLTSRGCAQAEELAQKLRQARESGDERLRGLLHPDIVLASPLTRAVQTAVIAMADALADPELGELVLLPSAREKQNLGGRDTKGTAKGMAIVERTQKALNSTLRGSQKSQAMKTVGDLSVDAREVEGRWWCAESSETAAQLGARMKDFMSQLQCCPRGAVVVVGHSHFFRELCSAYLSPDLRREKPDLAASLCTDKLVNCGIARLELDPQASPEAPIADVELVLGTTLTARRSRSRSGGGSSRR